MTMPAAPSADRSSALVWDFMRRDFARRAAHLAAFGLLYAVLAVLGLLLRERSQQLTIMWPAAGLLFMALWLSPRRNWIWILAIQVSIEMLSGAIVQDQFRVLRYLPFAVANSIDAAVGAWIASRLIPTPRVPKMRNVLLFIASVAVGAAASSAVGAFGT